MGKKWVSVHRAETVRLGYSAFGFIDDAHPAATERLEDLVPHPGIPARRQIRSPVRPDARLHDAVGQGRPGGGGLPPE
jgi:hypothetical protein